MPRGKKIYKNMSNVILPPGAPATVLPKLNTSLSGVISAEQSPNFVTDTGASNALVVVLTDITTANVPLAAGLRLLIKTANTLQAGANTLSFNTVVKNIKNQNLVNLSTSYVSGALIDLAYDGTQWQMIGQTG